MEQKFKLWEDLDIDITYYPSLQKSTDATVVILPGGGYAMRAPHEGEGYAQFINVLGMDAFVVDYRVAPNRFPLPLLDARRAMRFVRANAEKFGIAKDKVLIMGSSAGGHLSALTSTYLDAIDGEGVDEIDNEDFLPNGQILCYPVISSDETVAHTGSYKNLLDERYPERDKYSPDLLVSERTPIAFIWHTSEDGAVNVINSYRYGEALRKNKIAHEMHIFPHGVHGLGLGQKNIYVSEWTSLLRRWLMLNDFLPKF